VPDLEVPAVSIKSEEAQAHMDWLAVFPDMICLRPARSRDGS
jgi:hypothetical protein